MKQSIIGIIILGYLFATATSVKIRKEQSASSSSSGSSTSITSSASTAISSGSTDIVASLILARTAVDRINILNEDTDFIFNFLEPPTNTTTVTGKGGSIVIANRESFPAVVGNGISMGIGFISACGLNTPHTHPRATEIFYAVNGTFKTGFIAENGARQVINTVNGGTGAIFPKGSIHWQANLGCDQVVFVAALSDEDPGLSTIAQNFYSIDEGILSATLGGVSANSINETESIIPAGVVLGLQSCLQKCGLAQSSSSKDKYGKHW